MIQITLHYTCSKCGRVDSQTALPTVMEPYLDCPACGGSLVFVPNCYTCAEMKDAMCVVVNCANFSAYRQKVN